jgi:hypothetical protein
LKEDPGRGKNFRLEEVHSHPELWGESFEEEGHRVNLQLKKWAGS